MPVEKAEYDENGLKVYYFSCKVKVVEVFENGFTGIEAEQKQSLFSRETMFFQHKNLGDKSGRIKLKKGDIIELEIKKI